MKKKIISFLFLLSVIVTMLPCGYAMAEDTGDLKRRASVLQSLGVDDIAASGIATNDYILTSLSGFLYEKEYKPSAEDFARNIGVLDFGVIYDGSKTVTKNEAVAYAVATLGYKEYAESMGENGVTTVASSLGVTKGMRMSGDDAMSVDECRMMLYNMLEIEPMVAVYSVGERKHIIEKGQTSLSKYRNIHRIYGVLKADTITSIDKVDGCGDGFVQINDSLYAMDSYSKKSNLLGKNVEAYINTDTDYEPEVLYLGERTGTNEELEISAKDVEGISEDYLILEYYRDYRLKKAKIADVPKVIYNGVFYGKYTVPDFKPEEGKLRLVDNNDDGRYDVIFISSYETVIVDAIDAHDKTIYNRFTSDGNLPMVSLEPDTNDVKYTISDGIAELEFSDIKISDVLSVARSRSSENVAIEILVCRDVATGMLQSIDEVELEININDEVYPVTPAFFRFRNIEGNANIGGTYTFFFDALGNVAYWKKLSEDGYAVMQKAYFDDINYKTYVSYMNLDGIWIDAPIAKKLKLNENIFKDEEIIYENLKDVKGQLVKMEFNPNGEIKKIEIATETAGYDKDMFTKTPMAQYTWRSGVRAFSDIGTAKCRYYIEDDAKLIVIPQDYRSKSNYEVRDPVGFFSGDVDYKISAYDIDEFGFSKIIVMQYEPQIKNTLFIVAGISKVAVDGEACTRLKGHAGDFENITLTGTLNEDGKDALGDVKEGMIIKVSLNGEGYVNKYEEVFDLSAFVDKTGTQYTSSSYMAGSVSAIDAASGRIQIDVNGDKYTFRIDNTMTVQLYDERGNIEKSNIYSIVPRMKVFVDMSWGNVKQMIVKR